MNLVPGKSRGRRAPGWFQARAARCQRTQAYQPFLESAGLATLRPSNEWALWSKPESGYRRSNWRTFVVRRRRLQAQHASAQPSGNSFAPRAQIQDDRFDVRPRADLASRDPPLVPRGTPPAVRYEFGSF